MANQVNTTPKGQTSLQRSMEIFSRLTNLFVEWNKTVLVASFKQESRTPEFWEEMHQQMAKSIVENIKAAKGCWVKVGQMISTKPWLLPKCYIEAFTELQDKMDNSDFSEIIDTIENELGYMDDLFKNFDAIPVASASIAQVHKATLMNGQRVAVKVQHKSSEQNLKNDLEVLRMVSWMIQSGGYYQNVCDFVEEYANSVVSELDFTNELTNIQNAYNDAQFSKIPIVIPRPYPMYCSHRVITMQFLDLHKIIDKDFMIENNINVHELMYDVYDFMLFQVLYFGRIHGDPHPGNIQVARCPKTNRIKPSFLDWGLTIFINNMVRINACRLYMNMYMADTTGSIQEFINIGFDISKLLFFEFDRLLEVFIPLYLSRTAFLNAISQYNTAEQGKQKQSCHIDFNQRSKYFLAEFMAKAPVFLPTILKSICEFRNISYMIGARVAFTDVLYKNATFAYQKLYDNTIIPYVSSIFGIIKLHRRISRLRAIFKIGNEDFLYKKLVDDFNNIYGSRLFMQPIAPVKYQFSKLELRITEALEFFDKGSFELVGVQIAVINNKKFDAALCYGRTARFDKRPVTPNCLFPLGFISSNLLAIGILHLVAENRIKLDESVSTYWKDFGKNEKESVTIRQILNQTSGIIFGYSSFPLYNSVLDYELMVKRIENTHIYHNLNLPKVHHGLLYNGWIMAEIIRKVTGQTGEAYIQELFLKCGLDPATFCFPSLSLDSAKATTKSDNENSSKDNTNSTSEQKTTSDGINPIDKEQSMEDDDKNNQNVANNLESNTISTDCIESNSNSYVLQSLVEFDNSQSCHLENGTSSGGINVSHGFQQFANYKTEQILEQSVISNEKEISENRMLSVHEELTSSTRVSTTVKIKSLLNSEKNSNDDFITILPVGPPKGSSDTASIVESDGNVSENVKNHMQNFLDDDAYLLHLPPSDCVCDITFGNPDTEFRRCLFPRSTCPKKTRFVEIYRPHDIFAVIGDLDSRNPKLATSGVIDANMCQVLTNMDTGHKGYIRMNSTRNRNSSSPRRSPHAVSIDSTLQEFNGPTSVGFTNFDLIRYGAIILDPINNNHEYFYKHSIPALNGRISAFSLAKFYSMLTSDTLGLGELIQDALSVSYMDQSFISWALAGGYGPKFSLGFQTFTLIHTKTGEHYQGIGMVDVGGSVVMTIPRLELSISMVISREFTVPVHKSMIRMILAYYNLQLHDPFMFEYIGPLLQAAKFDF
ncbi:bifunctional Protein kinase-like domain superfamily/ABC1 atypical kinase-like domain/Beta-lactamase-transpeptidase-like/Beta-lactamase-related [Babesia duncani]|uniref:Bifunctional Protein kinase-like domain superfamily/ABC1 atypical kinase-like domain/Beta-lactamase-transpeptidase-like/Beta-lactamase-related n=1 Tax=Babesia duncani TaxID=323732 RepID=A0AAD9PL88_9APIC|nr:bifunctional Protein kinase-like domain superfamily/ABC1 atypical kinase-like domain/Beta-lactamase-transpeptidase-like/Beta-lactamase-related [Babesia duncani]